MKARHKRRTRRTQQNHSEAAALQRISNQLTRLQAPVDPDVLSGINAKFGLADVQASATRRGAVAGAVAGTLTSSLVVTALMLIKARLGL